ncbi:MAG: family 10 glycosylhydrolase [Scytonema sp. PMC 1069.18]|nr:family 10 glycosylhydrolase [Scytonema sp. PMC 1069.18]MEC4882851.1 family 10 glycosylhydrolase [Scytonema sp. PMC 1070.18]
MNIKAILLSFLLLGATLPAQSQQIPTHQQNITPPAPLREFRGAWVATVGNIDWPSKRNLTTEQQQAELIAILDRAVELKLNAIVLQVRPASDALYASPYEPWSEYLTGQMGKAPEPYYDPLTFAVEEAHKRGLELHAWFNPFRARYLNAISEVAPNHISKTQPQLVKRYGKFLWLDPGEQAAQDYALKVIMDVVRRYDIDGVHLDDYFYPYPERKQSRNIDFPDDSSWQKYLRSGGKLSRNDWRRENINTFIRRLYQDVKAEKSWVKVGISPFGIWKPGYPIKSNSFNAYDELYADSRQWLMNGWLDYLSPQLYWKIEQTQQSYPVLLNWWLEQNTSGRHIWSGLYTSRVGNNSPKGWNAREIMSQIQLTRAASSGGNVHFSMKTLMQNSGGITDLLEKEVYTQSALIPASPWLNNTPPDKPELTIRRDPISGRIQLTWKATDTKKVASWVVQTRTGRNWTTTILPVTQTSYMLNNSFVDAAAVSAVSRYGIQGTTAVLEVKENQAAYR